MHDVITRLRNKKEDEGFTLIELLVVVVIIGVLVAIAVPVYLNYRKGAADKSAQSDVRGSISAIEQYYTDNGNTYPTLATIQSVGPNDPKALVLINPTAGVDVRSKESLLGAVRAAADGGTGVLMISDELDDLRHCDRVLVMFHGRVTAELQAGWSDTDVVATRKICGARYS